MKKAPLLGVLLFAGAFFIAPQAHASTFLLYNADFGGASLNSVQAIDSIDLAPNGDFSCPHGIAMLKVGSIDYGSSHVNGDNSYHYARGCTGGASSGNITTFLSGGDSQYPHLASPGNYLFYFYAGNTSNLLTYMYISWDGTTATMQGGLPAEAGDHPELSGVIRYNAPAIYGTTTTPFTLSFDGVVNADASTTDGYRAIFTSDNGCVRTRYGLLDSYTLGTPFTYSTSTDMLDGFCTGALRMTIEFGGGVGDLLQYGTPFYGSGYALGIVFAYGTSTYSSTLNYSSYTPPVFGGYASSSCALSLNPFAESNFSVSECAGYLFVPGDGGFAQYSQFKDQLAGKFPFSYFYSAQGTWSALTVSNGNASPTYSFNLHNAGLGSTSPIGNFLPNTVVFSASTTKQYFPGNTFDILKALAAAAIWLTFFAYVFFHTRDILKQT